MKELNQPVLANLDLNWLPALHALIRRRSVTHAAAAMGMSQPALSKILGRLRQAFGDPLFVKTSTGFELTDQARALEEPLERWFAATRHLLRAPVAGDPATFSGTFRIASTDYGVLTVISPALAAIMRLAPALRIEITPLSAVNHTELDDGTLDLVITGFDPNQERVCGRKLFTETYRCLLAPDHPYLAGDESAHAAPMKLDHFIALPHVQMIVNHMDGDDVCERLAAIGRKRRIAMRLPYFALGPNLALASDAMMVLPQRAADHFARTSGLVSVSAPIELGTFDYWLIWHERSRRDPVTQWMIDRLSDPATAT